MSKLVSSDTAVNLVINKLTREMYNELSDSLSPYELYLIDDVNFDVFGKKIVNVLSPTDENDAVNLLYMNSNCVLTSNIDNYIDTHKIISQDGNSCLSADGYTYTLKMEDADWRVVFKSGIQPSESLSVKYNGEKGKTGTNIGWMLYTTTDNYFTGITDLTTRKFYNVPCTKEGTSELIYVDMFRDCWELKEKTIKASVITDALSSISYGSTLNEVTSALVNLKNSLVV